VYVQPDKCADLVHECPPSSTKIVLVGLEVFGRPGREGHDIWPPVVDGTLTLTPAQMALLIEAMDWRRTVAPPLPARPMLV
jgi:hypothetical protein